MGTFRVLLLAFKRHVLWLAVGSALVVFSGGVGLAVALHSLNAPTGTVPKEVEIQKGMTVQQIGRVLRREGIIRSPRLLRLFALLYPNLSPPLLFEHH